MNNVDLLLKVKRLVFMVVCSSYSASEHRMLTTFNLQNRLPRHMFKGVARLQFKRRHKSSAEGTLVEARKVGWGAGRGTTSRQEGVWDGLDSSPENFFYRSTSTLSILLLYLSWI